MSHRVPGLALIDCEVTEAGKSVRAPRLVGVSHKSEEVAPPFEILHARSLLFPAPILRKSWGAFHARRAVES